MIDPREDPRDTLCIYCRLAVHGDCSWRKNFIPVDGWSVDTSKGGCHVNECPLFEEGRGLSRQIDTDGMLALLEACAMQMRDDYIHGRDYHNIDEENNYRSEYNALVRVSKKLSHFSTAKRKIDAEIRAINRKRIETWILGDGGRLMQISDPEALIQYLRQQARMQENKNMKLMSAAL